MNFTEHTAVGPQIHFRMSGIDEGGQELVVFERPGHPALPSFQPEANGH